MTDLGKAYIRLKKADFWPVRADFTPWRAKLRLIDI